MATGKLTEFATRFQPGLFENRALCGVREGVLWYGSELAYTQ